MTNKKLFRQSIFWRSIFFLTAVVSNILFARYFQASFSGSVFYLANVFAFAALLCGLGLESALTYFSSKRIIVYEKLAGFSVLWIASAGAAAFITVHFFLNFFLIPSNLSIPREKLEPYTAVYISGLMLTSFFSVLFYSKRNYLLPNLILGIINVLVIIYIPKTTHFTGSNNSVTDIYFYSTFAQGILLMLCFIIKYGYLKKISLPSFPQVKMLFRFSVVALGANIIFFLINRIDFFFVDKYCPKQDLGSYIQVSRLGQMLLLIPQILASVIFPQTARGTEEEEKTIRNITAIGRLFVQLYLFLFIMIIIFGNWFFPFVFGNSFIKMYLLMIIFLPGFFALSYLSVISAFFLGNGLLKTNLAGTAAALSVVITGDLFLVSRFGVFAAAVISASAYLINLFYSVNRFCKKFNVPFTLFFKWQKQDWALLKAMAKK